MAKARNSQLQLDFYGANSDVPARTPPQKERVHGEKSTSSHFICSEQSRLDGTQKDIGTEGEFTRMSRRKGDGFAVPPSVLKYVKTVVKNSAALMKFSTSTICIKQVENAVTVCVGNKVCRILNFDCSAELQ